MIKRKLSTMSMHVQHEPALRWERRRCRRPFATAGSCVVLLVSVLLPSLHGSASAQSVAGDVVDETGVAVASIKVGLIGEDGQLLGHGTSDASGHFRVEAPESGRYRVHVAGQGYRSLTGGPYDLVQGVTLELLVVVHRAPVQLEGLEVVADGRVPRLVSNGFYGRAAKGWGWFFEGEEVRQSGSGHIAGFLDRLPRVKVDARGEDIFGAESIRNPALFLETGGDSCVPALWVDGSLRSSGGRLAEPMRPDDWVGPGEIAGLEFYAGPASVPIEFAHSSACAVLVIWTRG